MSNGHIVEIQLHHKNILKAKGVETELYNKIREIKRNAKLEGRRLTIDEISQIQELEKKSKLIFENSMKND